MTFLKDRDKVNALNILSEQFYFNWIHSDSALKYSAIAYQHALSIHYNSGAASSLITRAGIEGRLLGHPRVMQEYSHQAIEVLSKENDPINTSRAYYALALAMAFQGKYDEAQNAAITARKIAVTSNEKSCLGWADQAIGFIYMIEGDYWKSFENLIEAQEIGQATKDSFLTSTSLAFIARSFNRTGDPKKAIEYYHKSLKFATPLLLLWPHVEDMANAFLQLKQYDSALYYHEQHIRNLERLTTDPVVQKKFIVFSLGFSADVDLANKEYDIVISALLPEIDVLRENMDIAPYMQALVTLTKAYYGKRNYSRSMVYAQELFQIASRSANKQFLKDANQLLYTLYESLHQTDESYFYLKGYTTLKDSMQTAQFAARTALYLAEAEAGNRISLLKKDKEINEQRLALNDKELHEQEQLKNFLVLSLIVLFLLSAVIIRNIFLKRKNEKLQNEQVQLSLNRKAAQLEMQALRSQMSPHFIFNCLSAIDNLIQTNQSDKATLYLSRFARMIRSVLDSSKYNLVPFQKDFDTLKLYLELEQFRCNNKFNFDLKVDQELLNGDFMVPPLIIQPFVENAIHHGLLNKQDNNRELHVSVELTDQHITYSVTDNGVGRKRAAKLKEMNRPEHVSYGIDITRERIHLHNKIRFANDILITDLEHDGMASGTRAVVKIDSIES